MNKIQKRNEAIAKYKKARKQRIAAEAAEKAARQELIVLYPNGGSWKHENSTILLTNEQSTTLDHNKALATLYNASASDLKNRDVRMGLFQELYGMDLEPFIRTTEYKKITVK